MSSGAAFVVSAPSGAGKTTLSRMLLAEFPNLRFSVSCCTRPKREGEIHGKDYFFITEAEFDRMRSNGEFAEWAEVHGNLYGTPLPPVLQALREGEDLLLDVDAQGAAQIRVALPNARFIFILPPTMAALEERLKKRSQDSEEAIKKRLANAREEIKAARWFDYVIVNDILEKSYESLRSIYLASTLETSRCGKFLESIMREKP